MHFYQIILYIIMLLKYLHHEPTHTEDHTQEIHVIRSGIIR